MSRAQKDQAKVKVEKDWRWCAVCAEQLAADHPGIHCLNSHHLCSDCSANAKISILSDADVDAFPPKCGFCASQLNLSSFERQLDEVERGTYLTMMMLKELPEGEIVHSCPFCPFFCTRVVADVTEAPFVHCQRPDCLMVSCALCKKACGPCSSLRTVGAGFDDAADMDEELLQGMVEHFSCVEKEAAHGKERDALLQAIESGIKPKCPSCQHAGTKDDACTHMTCESCHTVWCYICGLDTASEQCDKAQGEGRAEHLHNEDWYSKISRCPMYLSEIHQVDSSWPEDEDEAKAYLHRVRALRSLRQVYDKLGQRKYRQTIAAFPIVGPASGFTEEEIQAVDLAVPLFQRTDEGCFAYDDGSIGSDLD